MAERAGSPSVQILVGDALEQLRLLASDSVQCVVTSPPYFGLRDYGDDRQMGLEPTPEKYVARLVAVFSEVRRVMRRDATLWLNLGDTYASATSKGNSGNGSSNLTNGGSWQEEKPAPGRRNDGKGRGTPRQACDAAGEKFTYFGPSTQPNRLPLPGLKPKDLIGIPWRVAFALQADGWYLRSDIIWSKPNPMPESVTDRPTKSHEYLFLFAKSRRYFYDHRAIAEPQSPNERTRRLREQREGLDKVYDLQRDQPHGQRPPGKNGVAKSAKARHALAVRGTRNARTVWTITPRPFKDAHFATFPPALVEPCILAGTSPRACELCGSPWRPTYDAAVATGERGSGNKARSYRHQRGGPESDYRRQAHSVPRAPSVSEIIEWRSGCECSLATGGGRCVVLDPFAGAGTTGMVAAQLGRDAILIELNPAYAAMARERIDAAVKAEASA